MKLMMKVDGPLLVSLFLFPDKLNLKKKNEK